MAEGGGEKSPGETAKLLVRSPIKILGGKYHLVKRLLPLIPPHEVYVEPFCGAAHLFFAKPPSKVEVLNDKDGLIINFFRVLQDESKAEELTRRVYFTPYSRKIYNESRELIESGEINNMGEIDKAYYFLVANKMSFDGKIFGGWSYGYGINKRNYAVWNKIPERLLSAVERLKNVYLECDDFEKVMRRFDSRETFFYCDPPYLAETRYRNYYRYEFAGIEDHERFLDVATSVEGKVMISHYPHSLYKERLKNWRVIRVVKPLHAINAAEQKRRKRRVECVWMNYSQIDKI